MGRAIILIGEGWRESPLVRNLHFSDITFTVCGLKTGTNNNRNNTPATGESRKLRILFFKHPLLHLFLLLFLTPVLKSVWGPFCLSMMSYLVRVVAICQDTYTDTHNTQHTHRHSHSLFHLSSSEQRSLQGSVPPLWFFLAVTDLHVLKPMLPAFMLASTSQYYF